jgi:hypothetical protein
MARSDLLVSLVKAGTTGDKRGFQTLAANGSSVLIVAGKKRSPAKPWANAGPQAVAVPSCASTAQSLPIPRPMYRLHNHGDHGHNPCECRATKPSDPPPKASNTSQVNQMIGRTNLHIEF